MSEYSGELSTLFVTGRGACFSEISTAVLEMSIEEYHPCDDVFQLFGLSIVTKIYLEVAGGENSIENYLFPQAEEFSDKPTILHRPDIINGYEDNTLIIGAIGNFHNEIGVVYSWYLNDSLHCQ